MEKLFGVVEVAQVFSVSIPTVRRWVAEGKLPASRLGRRVLLGQENLEVFAKKSLRPYHPHSFGGRNEG